MVIYTTNQRTLEAATQANAKKTGLEGRMEGLPKSTDVLRVRAEIEIHLFVAEVDEESEDDLLYWYCDYAEDCGGRTVRWMMGLDSFVNFQV